MNNTEAAARFSETRGVTINKLFWIAASLDNEDLIDFMNELDGSDWERLFPEIHRSKNFAEYLEEEQGLQALVDFRRFGLIAEIHLPKCDNFRYDEDANEPCSWSIHGGNCRVEVCYAETLEELLLEIEKTSEKVFKEYVDKDKERKQS